MSTLNRMFIAVAVVSLTYFISCRGSEKSKSYDKSDTGVSSLVEKVAANSQKNVLERYIEKYLDSVNAITSEGNLPSFLRDAQFDYRNRGIWRSLHDPISVRAQIINRIPLCKPLEFVVASLDEKIKEKPRIEEGLVIPFMDMSFYDLVLKRIRELNCE